MNADAIIFDKDGTLIDFDAFWVSVSIKALEQILTSFNKREVPLCELLESFGVHNGITDIDSVLCKGTYEQLGQIVYDILHQYGCDASCNEVTTAVTKAFNENSDAGEVKPTCPELVEVLKSLKTQGKKLAVVTTDNEYITRKCLKKLGIEGLFDKIYTDDGKTPTKPDPYCINDFCAITGIKPENTVMVGDTLTDVSFAKNAGITSIAIAKNERNRGILEPYADIVLSDLSKLLNILG